MECEKTGWILYEAFFLSYKQQSPWCELTIFEFFLHLSAKITQRAILQQLFHVLREHRLFQVQNKNNALKIR